MSRNRASMSFEALQTTGEESAETQTCFQSAATFLRSQNVTSAVHVLPGELVISIGNSTVCGTGCFFSLPLSLSPFFL